MRAFLFEQSRALSHFYAHMDQVFDIIPELFLNKGAFHIKVHFSSSQLTCWFYDNPYPFHRLTDLLGAGLQEAKTLPNTSHMNIDIVRADYGNPIHQVDIPRLLDLYAQDPMGGGEGLNTEVKARLVAELAKRPDAFSVLAYVDGKAAGLINCFEGFSTFAAQPLVNIHDVVVLDGFRGLGLSQCMLEQVEAIALERGYIKLTLEVLSGNEIAKRAYRKFGFSDYELDPKAGTALFWQKRIG